MVSYDLENGILEEMKKDPKISILRLSFNLGCHETTIQTYLDKLKADGKVARVGGRRAGHWEVYDG